MNYDLLVRRGRIVDGSGLPSYVADVTVKGGKVVEVGRLNGSAARILDADGLTKHDERQFLSVLKLQIYFMKSILPLLLFTVVTTVWCPPTFAQRQTAVGPGPVPLNADGVTDGVDITANGTLTVGVPGGPQMDIFTNNDPVNPALVAVSTSASSQGNIVFNSSSTVFGAIGITQPGGPFLLNISGGNAGTAVNFQGPVFATITTVGGTGALNFNSGSINITATNFAADGTLSLAPNTTLIGALTTTAGANTGTLVLGGASVLNGAVGGAVGLRAINVVGGSNNAGVSASITGAANAFTFNLGTNTLNVGGALNIANGGPNGVINTTLASPTVFGNIRPVGATTLGPTLLVNVLVPSTAFIPVGTLFNIVQTQTGTLQSGTDGSVLTVTVQNPTNPLYTFVAEPLAGTIAGLVTIRTTGIPLLVPITPPPGVVLPPTAPIAAVVVPAVLVASPTVLPAINALSDPVAVVNALAQLVPSFPGLAAPLVNFQTTRQFQNLWWGRLDDTLCGEVGQPDATTSTCPQNERSSGWWLKGFGYYGDQEARDTFVGYRSNTGGAMIAYDVSLRPDTRLGFGLGYARSDIDGKTFNASTDVDTYRATAYLGHDRGPWFVYGDASFGWNEYSGSRRVAFTGVNRKAEADYSGQEYTGIVTTGYRFFTPSRIVITPLASLQYTHLRLRGYSETGAGDINLKINSQSYDFLESALGVKVDRAFTHLNMTYVPEAHFKWFHQLHNPTLKNTAAFRTASSTEFTIPGFKADDNTFNIGTSLSLLSCACAARTWSVEAGYDYDWTTDKYSAHRGMIKFSHRF